MDFRQGLFEDCFFADLESWFSADIACCDFCHDAFISQWPLALAEGCSMYLPSFHSGSKRTQNHFDKNEFIERIRNIICPACGRPLGSMIYLYNLPFDPPDNFDNIAEEISNIAKQTPFLLLTNKYANDVYEKVLSLVPKASDISSGEKFWRGRRVFDNSGPAQFGPPPAKFVEEGRFNHAGGIVLYLANDETTCYKELGSPQEGVLMVIVELTDKIRVLDLVDIDDYETKDSLLQAIAYSPLASAPRTSEGWDRPEYVFSRFISDCAKHAGFDAIKYRSTKRPSGYNLVVISNRILSEHIKIHEKISLFSPNGPIW